MPSEYGFRLKMERVEVGHGVVGFAAFKHCLTAFVMAHQEMYPDKMVSSVSWTTLYLVNELIHDIPIDAEERWGYLSGLTESELHERWKDPEWPRKYTPVDRSVDEEEPPF